MIKAFTHLPKLVKYAIAALLLGLMWALFFGGQKVHAQTTCPADFNRWGNMNAGFGGMIVETKVRYLNGSEAHFNTNISVHSSDARGFVQAPGGSPNGTYAKDLPFTTGGTVYRIGGNSNACSHPGIVMFGYGTSPTSGQGQWGNTWVLDCTNSAGQTNTFHVNAGNGATANGHWELRNIFSGETLRTSTTGSFEVDNSSRAWVQFIWVEDPTGGGGADDAFLNIYISGYSGSVTMSLANSSDGGPHDVGRCTNRTNGVNSFSVSGSRQCTGERIGPIGIQPGSVSGYNFDGWSGCDSTNGSVCLVERYDAGSKDITAYYSPAVPPDNAPTFTMDADCSTIRIFNLSDPDSGGNIPVRVRIDGTTVGNYSGRGSWTLMNVPSNYLDGSSHNVEVRATSITSSGSTGSLTTSRFDDFGPCDTRPSISISSVTCPATPDGNGSFTLTSTDPDSSATYPVFYRIGSSGAWQSVSSPSATIDIPSSGFSPYDYFQIEAFADGILPNGSNAGSGSRSWTSGNYGVGPGKGCFGRAFKASPTASTTANDNENPTEVSFIGNIDVQTESPKLAFSNIRLTYYVIRASGTTTAPVTAYNQVNPPAYTINTSTNAVQGLPAAYRISGSALTNLSLSAGDQICSKLSITPVEGTVYSDGAVASISDSGPATHDSCVKITNHPYLKVYGGDVMAGGGFGSDCSNNNSTITTYGSGIRGSSTQYAAFATGTVTSNSIINFASAALRSSIAPAGPNGFTFGNIGALGNYSSSPTTCIAGFFGFKSGTTPLSEASALPPTQSNTNPAIKAGYDFYEVSHDTTLSAPLTLPKGRRLVLFVNGTLTISGNGELKYDSENARASVADIQSLIVVARNIKIASGVTRLDGIYIAEPSNSNDGVITTCDGDLTASTFANCGNQLKVYGSFIARKVNFYRTQGSLRSATPNDTTGSNAAEVFILNPDTYLVGSPFGTRVMGGYDSFAELPPIF